MHDPHQALARWSRYASFLTVVAKGRLHRAATWLRISEPTLSRQRPASLNVEGTRPRLKSLKREDV
jgi:hypothetical protein